MKTFMSGGRFDVSQPIGATIINRKMCFKGMRSITGQNRKHERVGKIAGSIAPSE